MVFDIQGEKVKGKVSGSFLELDFRLDGKRYIRKIPLSEIAENHVRKADRLPVGPKGAIKLREFTEIYFKIHSSKKEPTTKKRHVPIIANLNKRMGDMYLHEIDELTVERFRRARFEDRNPVTHTKIKPATVNRATSQLKHMMKMAVKWGYMEHNKLSGLEKLPEKNERDRWLKKEELGRLLGGFNSWMRDFLELLAWTGLRLGELRLLRWGDIDFDQGVMLVKTEKKQTLSKRYVFLRSRVRQILLRMHATTSRKTGYVFPSKTGTARMDALIHQAFKRGLKRSGIEYCVMHDLRRTFAVHHSIAYKDMFMLKDEIGHSDFRTLHRYVRYSRIYDPNQSLFSRDTDIGKTPRTVVPTEGDHTDRQ
jgi:integrase